MVSFDKWLDDLSDSVAKKINAPDHKPSELNIRLSDELKKKYFGENKSIGIQFWQGPMVDIKINLTHSNKHTMVFYATNLQQTIENGIITNVKWLNQRNADLSFDFIRVISIPEGTKLMQQLASPGNSCIAPGSKFSFDINFNFYTA
jgi:hypothetical protein